MDGSSGPTWKGFRVEAPRFNPRIVPVPFQTAGRLVRCRPDDMACEQQPRSAYSNILVPNRSSCLLDATTEGSRTVIGAEEVKAKPRMACKCRQGMRSASASCSTIAVMQRR
jgi:hypothetical protein